MKIYNFNENFIIKRLQKKEKTNLFNGSNYNVSQVQTKAGPITLVELLACGKVFCCDECMCRGNSLIIRTLEDNYVSIVDVQTGRLTKARMVDFYGDMMIVTLMDGSRRFIDKEGKVQEGEIGVGGFQNDNHSRTKIFVDENGNGATSSKWFIGLNGRVRCGVEDISAKGIYQAKQHFTDEIVYYSFLGNEIQKNEIGMYRDLYKFYKGEKKLKDLDDSCLLDSTVYNFIINEVHGRLAEKANEVKDVKGYSKEYDKIYDKLNETLIELQKRREMALEQSVNSTLENNTF